MKTIYDIECRINFYPFYLENYRKCTCYVSEDVANEATKIIDSAEIYL